MGSIYNETGVLAPSLRILFLFWIFCCFPILIIFFSLKRLLIGVLCHRLVTVSVRCKHYVSPDNTTDKDIMLFCLLSIYILRSINCQNAIIIFLYKSPIKSLFQPQLTGLIYCLNLFDLSNTCFFH